MCIALPAIKALGAVCVVWMIYGLGSGGGLIDGQTRTNQCSPLMLLLLPAITNLPTACTSPRCWSTLNCVSYESTNMYPYHSFNIQSMMRTSFKLCCCYAFVVFSLPPSECFICMLFPQLVVLTNWWHECCCSAI